MLYYLALEKPITKSCNLYELEREGFKKGQEIYLNANIWTDIDEYLKSKNEKLFKNYPFNRLSLKYRWADFYRDLVT